MVCIRRPVRIRVFVVTLVSIVATLVVPRAALARSFTMDSVTIDAALDAAGTLTVREEREFNFDGAYNGVYWEIPTGTYDGREIVTTITGVGEMVDGTYVAYNEADTEANHTYQLSEHANYIQVKVFTAHKDERARVVIAYTDTNLATRHADVGELYWKFVSDGWDEASKNVTCTVQLPVPDGVTVVGGDNVRAWGHGPLDASVAFVDNDVVYTVPGVGTSEFAEARITFPGEWLTGVEPGTTPALDGILAEEQAWADEANAQRARARAFIGGGMALGFGVPVLAVVVALLRRRTYRATHKAHFDDTYFRDVPSADHPAVLGALWRDGSPAPDDLTASLMRLTDMGVIRLEPTTLTVRKAFGRTKTTDDYRIVRTGREIVAAGDDPEGIDARTEKFLFYDLARHAKRDKYVGDAADAGDNNVLLFSEIVQIAKANPEDYDDAYQSWRGRVEAACTKRKFFVDDQQKVGRALPIALGVVSILTGIAAFFMLMLADAILAAFLSIVAGLTGAVVTFMLVAQLEPRSREAIELKAQLEALRRWLKDFTRLKEAVPNDVVLWNRLLVMATVLGVAKEVIDQLKMVAPQMLEDDRLMPVYGWYYYNTGSAMPASLFREATSNAHSVSTAALAASSDSDGGGGGGGFSGGGGGGFGGGGGGGAF